MRISRRAFPIAVIADVLVGGPIYRTWLVVLGVGSLLGAGAFAVQLHEGLMVTNMTDQVSWGAYIANFTFLVGVAAAALVMVLVPAYAYRMRAFRPIVPIGEALGVSAVAMSLIFVAVDVERPDRSWHLIPFWGSLNFPASLLSWDVVALGGYFVINLALLALTMRAKFYGQRPLRIYLPLVFTSMAWAIATHTVTAFLYTSVGARPFWSSAIVAPRFLASAFVSGPAFLVVALRFVQGGLGYPIDAQVYATFRRVITVALLVNMFLFASEVFTELYGGAHGSSAMRYLLFGAGEQAGIRAYVWTAIALEVGAAIVLLTPLARRDRALDLACVMVFVGVWIEKGMALVVPGFVPTPLGELADYVPSAVETLVSVGVWSGGLLAFTLLVRVGVRIESGQLRAASAAVESPREAAPARIEAVSEAAP